MSVELKIHSLLGQWFRRFGVSPGAWVSLLTCWCFDRFGVSPMSVLSQPPTYDIATLPTFFYHCFLAWIALGGSLSGGELVVGSSLAGAPLLVSTMTSKTCSFTESCSSPLCWEVPSPFWGLGMVFNVVFAVFLCPSTDK